MNRPTPTLSVVAGDLVALIVFRTTALSAQIFCQHPAQKEVCLPQPEAVLASPLTALMQMYIPLGELKFNEYGEQTTPAMMMQNLKAIGTVKDWVLKRGRNAGQTQVLIEAIEAMLVEGTKGFEFEPPFELIRELMPFPCRGVWYVYINTENGMDAQLYSKLAEAAQQLQQLSDKEELRKERARLLYNIEQQMDRERAAWVMKKYAARAAQTSGR